MGFEPTIPVTAQPKAHILDDYVIMKVKTVVVKVVLNISL
jgi:hypothetical protein